MNTIIVGPLWASGTRYILVVIIEPKRHSNGFYDDVVSPGTTNSRKRTMIRPIQVSRRTRRALFTTNKRFINTALVHSQWPMTKRSQRSRATKALDLSATHPMTPMTLATKMISNLKEDPRNVTVRSAESTQNDFQFVNEKVDPNGVATCPPRSLSTVRHQNHL